MIRTLSSGYYMTSETGVPKPKSSHYPLELRQPSAHIARCTLPWDTSPPGQAASGRDSLSDNGCSVGALRFDRRFILACMEHSLVSEGRKVKSI